MIVVPKASKVEVAVGINFFYYLLPTLITLLTKMARVNKTPKTKIYGQ
jgi:hypothetical protein